MRKEGADFHQALIMYYAISRFLKIFNFMPGNLISEFLIFNREKKQDGSGLYNFKSTQ